MKIQSVESFILRFPWPHLARDHPNQTIDVPGVRLQLESGVTGLGFTFTVDGGGEAICALIDHVLTSVVIGRDAEEVEFLWEAMWRKTHRLGRGICILGISVIDMAIWEARARDAGQPLWRFLGGTQRPLPAYASGRFSPALSRDELVRSAVQAVEEGMDAVKIRVGRARPQEDLDRLRAVRQAVGDTVRIMVDANENLDFPTALWLGRRLEDLGVFWFEEPIISDDVEGHRRLAERIPVALAVGEHLYTRFEALAYIRQQAAAILQPNVGFIGGVTEFLRVAQLAHAANLPLAPHFFTELHVHLAAAIPNLLYVEHFPWLDEFITEPVRRRGSTVLLPDGPGWGFDFRPEVWDRYRVA